MEVVTLRYMRWRSPQKTPRSCCMMSCTRRNNRRKIRLGGGDTSSGMTVIWVCDDGHALGETGSCQQKDFPWPTHRLLWFARPHCSK